jgi:hypothetical protein
MNIKNKLNMKTVKYFFILLAFVLSVCACEEQDRFKINSDDSVPPDKPTLLGTKQLYGGVRIFYRAPKDEDLLSIDAEYTSVNGKLFRFSASYFADSLDVYGLTNPDGHTIYLYATDRAGNKSEKIPIDAIPLEPAISMVAKSIVVKPGFNSFFVDWQNELEQSINVYVNFNYTQNGVLREHTAVFSSNLAVERRFINDLYLSADEPIKANVRIEDIYGNITDNVEIEQFSLLMDELIPKDKWTIPNANDSLGGVPMVNGDAIQGKTRYVIDGVVDIGMAINWFSTGGRGRTGYSKDGNVPWNLMVDLGDYYELSRIVTHQSHQVEEKDIYTNIGNYYGNYNVAIYNMYVWGLDEDPRQQPWLDGWVYVSQHKIPKPTNKTNLEIIMLAQAGDWAYMYPDDPHYTVPTRWFRFEALYGFQNNYTSTEAWGFSELTLYGKKANK